MIKIIKKIIIKSLIKDYTYQLTSLQTELGYAESIDEIDSLDMNLLIKDYRNRITVLEDILSEL